MWTLQVTILSACAILMPDVTHTTKSELKSKGSKIEI